MPLIAPAESANLIARVLQRQPAAAVAGWTTVRLSPLARQSGAQPMPAGRVGAALRAGLGAYSLQWPGGPGSGQRLSLMIAVLGLAGLAEGIYQAGAGPAGDLAVLPRQPVPAQVRRRYETYSVLFLVCGDARHGADSPDPGRPGALLVQAGALAELLALSARDSGLDCLVDVTPCYQVTATARKADRGLRHLITVPVRDRDGGHD